MDEESAQNFFHLTVIVVLLAIVVTLMGCTAMGLIEPHDGARDFYERLDRQAGG
jgi:hypothetical protein